MAVMADINSKMVTECEVVCSVLTAHPCVGASLTAHLAAYMDAVMCLVRCNTCSSRPQV